METQEIDDYFERKGVHPTPNRVLVLQALRRAEETETPMTLTDLETTLDPMDKSSIFRVLTLFLEQDIVHVFEDGRGLINYELCGSEGACDHTDRHIHFYCESCRQSFCMEEIPLPELDLPDGFTAHSISFVIKGECPKCRRRHALD